MIGWIKLHRKMIEWEWYSDNNTKCLFIHCLLKANIKSKSWKGIRIEKGQFFTSLGHLSTEINLSVKQIRIALRKLESTGELASEGASNGTKITVCKYDEYQVKEEARGQAEEQTEGKQGASEGQLLKKDKKEKEKNIPTFESFKTYALSKKPTINLEALKLKYDAWIESGWKDGNNNDIKIWKTKLLNTIPYLKSDKVDPRQHKNGETKFTNTI